MGYRIILFRKTVEYMLASAKHMSSQLCLKTSSERCTACNAETGKTDNMLVLPILQSSHNIILYGSHED